MKIDNVRFHLDNIHINFDKEGLNLTDFTNCEPYPTPHLAEYLSDKKYTSMMSSMEQTF